MSEVTLNTERKGVSIKWDPGDYSGDVTVYATGEGGDVHNKAPVPNSGEAGLFYPADFSGSSHVEIKTRAGEVIAEGTINVGSTDTAGAGASSGGSESGGASDFTKSDEEDGA